MTSLHTLEQQSDMRHHPEWQVRVDQDDMYFVRAADAEDAAWFVANELGFRPQSEEEAFQALHFRHKHFSSLLLPDGRRVDSEPLGYEDG